MRPLRSNYSRQGEHQRYYKKNKEYIQERQRNYYAQNREIILAKQSNNRRTVKWLPIGTAPKTAQLGKAIYILGYVPDHATVTDPEMGIEVIWWEPVKKYWASDAGEDIKPSNWQRLPHPPLGIKFNGGRQ